MRKGLTILFTIFLCLALCSCGKSERAENVDNLILSIGEVTLKSGEKIQEAEKAVTALEEADYKQLDQLPVLEEAKNEYLILQAHEIEKLIDSIKAGTIENEKTIKKARAAYDDSDDAVKEKVLNYSKLEKIEQDLSDLKIQNAIDAINRIGDISLENEISINEAKKAYRILNEAEKSQVTNYAVLSDAEKLLSDLKVQYATDAINNIGTVTLSSKEKIIDAQKLYSKLNTDERAAVANYDKLKEARKKLDELQKQEEDRIRQQAVAKMRTVTDKVQGITWYYPNSFPMYINSRSNVLPYIGKDNYSTWLRLRINYAGSRWVFFESVIFAVDGDNYYKTYDYFDVSRDNAGSMVGEYVDFNPTEEDIAMLKTIADSDETIVRFQGQDYYSDLTVSSTDKQAIKDVLAAYEVLSNP